MNSALHKSRFRACVVNDNYKREPEGNVGFVMQILKRAWSKHDGFFFFFICWRRNKLELGESKQL